MLPPQSLELLTAYVDGELAPRQRRAAERLIRMSAEARNLLVLLQKDALRLRELPTVGAPTDLSRPVLNAIARRQLRPGGLTPSSGRLRHSFPLWSGFVAAAAVLLVVGAGSFLYYSAADDGFDILGIAQVLRDPDAERLPVLPRPNEVAHRTPAEDEPPDQPEPGDRLPPDGTLDPDSPRPDQPLRPRRPDPLRPNDPVLTSPDQGSVQPFERIRVALPVIHRLHELDQQGEAKQLHAHLAEASAWRVEILCRDATRAFEYIRNALTARKVSLLVEGSAKIRLQRHYPGSEYALFVEGLTPTQLVEVLQGAGRADRAAGKKKSADQRFEGSLVVKEIAGPDQRELLELLGVDPIKVRPTGPLAGAKPTGVVVNLSIAGILTRRDRAVKDFREARTPIRPGTVQLLLVLRHLPS